MNRNLFLLHFERYPVALMGQNGNLLLLEQNDTVPKAFLDSVFSIRDCTARAKVDLGSVRHQSAIVDLIKKK